MTATAPQPPILPVHPFRAPVSATAAIPGSKSISNRALLLAYLADGPTRIENLLASEDTRALLDAFATLGVTVAETAGAVTVDGCSGAPRRREGSFDVRNAGTVARFLPAALSLLPDGDFFFDGSPAMRKRPMAGLLDGLSALGARIECPGKEGHFPFRLKPRGWGRAELTVDASLSSQILSALLLAALRAPRESRFALQGGTVSRPFVEMTLAMISPFGGEALAEDGAYRVRRGLPGTAEGVFQVEPDATAASYFFALPLAVGGACSVAGFPQSSLQGDLAFLDVLRRVGMVIHRGGDGLTTVTVQRDPTARSDTMQDLFLDVDFNAFSDTFLTLAALAPLFPGPTRITGIGHTRVQETDRVAAMATELRRLGQQVEEEDAALTVVPRPDEARRLSLAAPVEIETYEDHRVAMSFGILGCHDLHGDGRPWIAIKDPGCCGKTFPGFFEELARLQRDTDPV